MCKQAQQRYISMTLSCLMCKWMVDSVATNSRHQRSLEGLELGGRAQRVVVEVEEVVRTCP